MNQHIRKPTRFSQEGIILSFNMFIGAFAATRNINDAYQAVVATMNRKNWPCPTFEEFKAWCVLFKPTFEAIWQQRGRGIKIPEAALRPVVLTKHETQPDNEA